MCLGRDVPPVLGALCPLTPLPALFSHVQCWALCLALSPSFKSGLSWLSSSSQTSPCSLIFFHYYHLSQTNQFLFFSPLTVMFVSPFPGEKGSLTVLDLFEVSKTALTCTSPFMLVKCSSSQTIWFVRTPLFSFKLLNTLKGICLCMLYLLILPIVEIKT